MSHVEIPRDVVDLTPRAGFPPRRALGVAVPQASALTRFCLALAHCHTAGETVDVDALQAGLDALARIACQESGPAPGEWQADLQEMPRCGGMVLAARGATGDEIAIQVDAPGRACIGTWVRFSGDAPPGGALFDIRPDGMGWALAVHDGQAIRTIPLGPVVAGFAWTRAPEFRGPTEALESFGGATGAVGLPMPVPRIAADPPSALPGHAPSVVAPAQHKTSGPAIPGGGATLAAPCGRCGFAGPPGGQFCEQCGTRVQP